MWFLSACFSADGRSFLQYVSDAAKLACAHHEPGKLDVTSWKVVIGEAMSGVVHNQQSAFAIMIVCKIRQILLRL